MQFIISDDIHVHDVRNLHQNHRHQSDCDDGDVQIRHQIHDDDDDGVLDLDLHSRQKFQIPNHILQDLF